MPDEFEAELKQFYMDHPWPDKSGKAHLYKYYSFDPKKIDRLETLLVDRKLYHSLPEAFNDPFECKPHFVLPSSPEKKKKIAMHLQAVAIKNGFSLDDATAYVSSALLQPEKLEETILSAAKRVYGEIRVCCLTTHNKNLLLWSHYANSHRGFCIEYDALSFPISYAYKVKYDVSYPIIEYPRPMNELGFIPALVKSPDWKYENEYRTIFTPEAPGPIVTDGESMILGESDITAIYLGANMDDATASTILEILNRGPFKPKVFKSVLSRNSYEIEFVPYVPSA